MFSSSQDEIIEISNSSSSLDDDYLKPVESACLHNDISISPKITSNSVVAKALLPLSSSSKPNKRYQSKFKEWLSNSYFSTFLRECKVDPTKALCITFNLQFSIQNSEIGDIKHHTQIKKTPTTYKIC